ncbi:MAG: hypothetical protein ACI4O0_05640 [Candidatus Limivicinus sp.]
MKKSLFLCFLLCMALLLSACGTSSAPAQPAATDAPAVTEAPSPVEASAAPEVALTEEQEAALAAAQAALDELYDLGLLSTHHHLNPVKASHLGVTEPDQKANTFNDRILPPCYYVNCGTAEGNWVAIYVSIDSGKALACSIDIRPQEGDAQLEKEPIDMDGRKLYFYDNFDRVMREDMTLEEYCTLLNDYWGFEGYTISGTQYADYGYDTQPPAGDTLMKDLMDHPFVTLYFAGDQEDMPMFLEGLYFPEVTHFNFGFFHTVG